MDKQHATPYQQQLVAMRAALLAQMAAQRGGDIGRVEAASAHFSHSEESPAQMATEKEIEFAIGDHEVVELTAIEAALCHGWIDGQLDKYDAESWLIRFTPRKARSKWSEVNRTRAEELIAAGRMRPRGLAEVERAKADGRWDRAYASGKDMKVPDDLQAAIDAEPKAIVGTTRYRVALEASHARLACCSTARDRHRLLGRLDHVVEARDGVDLGRAGQLLRGDLVAHGRDAVVLGADEGDALFLDLLGKPGFEHALAFAVREAVSLLLADAGGVVAGESRTGGRSGEVVE